MSEEQLYFWAQEKNEIIKYQFKEKEVCFFHFFKIIHAQFEKFRHTNGSPKPPSINRGNCILKRVFSLKHGPGVKSGGGFSM